jgi:hypothetical protein
MANELDVIRAINESTVNRRIPRLKEGVNPRDFTVTTQSNGSIEVASMLDGRRISKVYYDYTKTQAVAEFTKYLNKLKANGLKESRRSMDETRDVGSRASLRAVVKALGKEIGSPEILNWDWHEPDQLGISGKVKGKILDNSGAGSELVLVIYKDGRPKFQVNLATLLQLAINPKSEGVRIGWDDIPMGEGE